MSGKDFSQVIAAVEQNQHDMLELISNWKALIDDTVSQDVTFTFFDGTVYTHPNIKKLSDIYGAATATPTPDAIVRRDSAGQIFAQSGIRVWDDETTPVNSAVLDTEDLQFTHVSGDSAHYSHDGWSISGVNVSVFAALAQVGVTDPATRNYIGNGADAFIASHTAYDYQSVYGTSVAKLQYKESASGALYSAEYGTSWLELAGPTSTGAIARLQTSETPTSSVETLLWLHEGLAGNTGDMYLGVDSLQFLEDDQLWSRFDRTSLRLYDNAGDSSYGAVLTNDSLIINDSGGDFTEMRETFFKVGDGTDNKAGLLRKDTVYFEDDSSNTRVAEFGRDGFSFDNGVKIKGKYITGTLAVGEDTIETNLSDKLVISWSVTVKPNTGIAFWYPGGSDIDPGLALGVYHFSTLRNSDNNIRITDRGTGVDDSDTLEYRALVWYTG